MSPQTETHEFQAEARQLLQLMIHSIYSNKDIFLRELISNASDALDKVRRAKLVDSSLQAETDDLHVRLDADREQRTLTVRDNGIGMTRDEVVDLIGTVAKSGTAELLEQLRATKDTEKSRDLIGRFGVGFYATFMVADRVTLVTRRAGEDTGTRWESTGDGTYTVAAVEDAPQGTAVTVHLKPADEEDRLFDYTEEWKIREIVKRYSDFIAWPIRMEVERRGEDGGDDAPKREEATLNSMKALWSRPRSEVKDEEYHEFYRHVSHDWNDPLETVSLRAEGAFEYEALLFIPSRAPFDLHTRESESGVQLYVKRVFIMDHCKELMPEYLRFVKGVVDAQDLSLNISRELLQQDRQIHLMRRRLVKKVLSTVKSMRRSDRERYDTFWREFGRAVKEGLLSDTDNQGALLEIVSFSSTADSERQTSLAEYVERMKEGQEEIYFMTGSSRSQIENSPHMEAFHAKGYEVLLLTDPVDEMWVEAVHEFDGKRLQSIAKGQVDLDEAKDEDEQKPADEQREKEFAPLLSWLRERLGEQVKDVRLSTRLTTSPACLVNDAQDMTPMMEKMYRAMGHAGPQIKRILELNPGHPLVAALREAHGTEPGDPALVETAELLHGTALLAEGGELEDPARFARLLSDRLARTL